MQSITNRVRTNRLKVGVGSQMKECECGALFDPPRKDWREGCPRCCEIQSRFAEERHRAKVGHLAGDRSRLRDTKKYQETYRLRLSVNHGGLWVNKEF